MHVGEAELQARSALPCWSRPGPAGTWGLHCTFYGRARLRGLFFGAPAIGHGSVIVGGL